MYSPRSDSWSESAGRVVLVTYGSRGVRTTVGPSAASSHIGKAKSERENERGRGSAPARIIPAVSGAAAPARGRRGRRGGGRCFCCDPYRFFARAPRVTVCIVRVWLWARGRRGRVHIYRRRWALDFFTLSARGAVAGYMRDMRGDIVFPRGL